jgi:hypothetical protein
LGGQVHNIHTEKILVGRGKNRNKVTKKVEIGEKQREKVRKKNDGTEKGRKINEKE